MRNGTGGLRGIYGHAADGQLGAPGVDIDKVQPLREAMCLVFFEYHELQPRLLILENSRDSLTAQVKFISRVCANLALLSPHQRLGGAWTSAIGPVDVVTADDKADRACACIYTTPARGPRLDRESALRHQHHRPPTNILTVFLSLVPNLLNTSVSRNRESHCNQSAGLRTD